MAVLIDTNILVYVYAGIDHRRELAVNALKSLEEGYMVSTQVISEFYSCTTRKKLLAAEDALRVTQTLLEGPVIDLTPTIIKDALAIHRGQSINYWDALIIAAARAGGCRTLWTEDLQHGQTIAGVKIINPLQASR